MAARIVPLLLFGWTCLSLGAIPDLSVIRTNSLILAVSDLTTNGIPGLADVGPGVVVSGIPARSTRGGCGFTGRWEPVR